VCQVVWIRRRSVVHVPVMPRETGGYEGRVSNASNVAAYLEWGTRPHVEEGTST
jgi:hypothetical protein